jgi:pSer/pThr/pTyr-binding forkhead associated (FHA) protein
VAAKHATLNTKKNKVIIKDTNSKAGLYVNDKRINEAELKDGDVIRVGEAQFLFKLK